MNRQGASAAGLLFCVGVILVYVGWLGWRGTPAPIIRCGDDSCTEVHP